MSERDEQSPFRVKLPQRSPFEPTTPSSPEGEAPAQEPWPTPPTGSAYPRPIQNSPVSSRGPRPVRRIPTQTSESPFEQWSDDEPWLEAIQHEDATISRQAFQTGAEQRGQAFFESGTKQQPAMALEPTRERPILDLEATQERPGLENEAQAATPARPSKPTSALVSGAPQRPAPPRRPVAPQDTALELPSWSESPAKAAANHQRPLLQHGAAPDSDALPVSRRLTRPDTTQAPQSVAPAAPPSPTPTPTRTFQQQETLLQHRALVFPSGQAPFEEPFPAQPEIQRPRSLDLKGSELHPAEQSQPRIILTPQHHEQTAPPPQPPKPAAEPIPAPTARPPSPHDTALTHKLSHHEQLIAQAHLAQAQRLQQRQQELQHQHPSLGSAHTRQPEVTLTAIAMPAFHDLPDIKPFQPLRSFGWLSAALLTAAAFLPTHTTPFLEAFLQPLEVSLLALISLIAVCGVQLWKTKEQTRSYAGSLLSLVLVGLCTVSLRGALEAGVFQGQPALSALSPGGIGLLMLGIGFWCGALITFWRSRGPATRLRGRILLALGLGLCALPLFGVGLAGIDMPGAWFAATQSSPFLGDRIAATIALGLLPLALISVVIAVGPLASQARTLSVITWFFGVSPLLVLALFTNTSADWIEAFAPLKSALFIAATVIYLGAASGSLSLLYRDARSSR